jgi:hypothetical protein
VGLEKVLTAKMLLTFALEVAVRSQIPAGRSQLPPYFMVPPGYQQPVVHTGAAGGHWVYVPQGVAYPQQPPPAYSSLVSPQSAKPAIVSPDSVSTSADGTGSAHNHKQSSSKLKNSTSHHALHSLPQAK